MNRETILKSKLHSVHPRDTTFDENEEPILKLFKEKSPAESEKPLAKYFYSIKNHHELVQIGTSFLDDFNQGSKSFAITSTGYKTSQQRTILALASFFDHVSTMKIAIVSNQLNHGAFHEMVQSSNKAKLLLPVEPPKSLPVKRFYHHFDFIDFDDVLKLAPEGVPTFGFEHAVSELVNHYDILFWDIPELESFKANHRLYYPIALYFDSLSIIVSQSLSKAKEVDELQKFFLDYGMNIKGILLDHTSVKKPEKRGFNPFNFLRRVG